MKTTKQMYEGELGKISGIKLRFMTNSAVDGIMVVCGTEELTKVMKKTFEKSFITRKEDSL